MMKIRKRPSKRTTTDDKGQVDLKGVTNDEITTNEGSNVKILNSNMRLYDDLMNTTKRPSRRTTTNNKGQADLKGVTNDEITTKEV